LLVGIAGGCYLHHHFFASDDSECESSNSAAGDCHDGASGHDIAIAIWRIHLRAVAAHRRFCADGIGHAAKTMAGRIVPARAGGIRRPATWLRKQRNYPACNVGHSGWHVYGDRLRFLGKCVAVEHANAGCAVIDNVSNGPTVHAMGYLFADLSFCSRARFAAEEPGSCCRHQKAGPSLALRMTKSCAN
jgi:hypothetical protein